MWRPSLLWAQNVSPEGRAWSEVKVLKVPLAVQVLGWCWAGRAGFHGMSSAWQHHCVCGVLQQCGEPALLWNMG